MVRYAYFKKLDYFSTECIYSPDAYRGHARAFLKDLEVARPSAIIDIIHSGEAFEVKAEVKATQKAQSRICLILSDFLFTKYLIDQPRDLPTMRLHFK
jgi:tRNA(Ile)-lysidine synthase TilS/MesJ